jgi:hypothetical protein
VVPATVQATRWAVSGGVLQVNVPVASPALLPAASPTWAATMSDGQWLSFAFQVQVTSGAHRARLCPCAQEGCGGVVWHAGKELLRRGRFSCVRVHVCVVCECRLRGCRYTVFFFVSIGGGFVRWVLPREV